jgi:hypothetical protein
MVLMNCRHITHRQADWTAGTQQRTQDELVVLFAWLLKVSIDGSTDWCDFSVKVPHPKIVAELFGVLETIYTLPVHATLCAHQFAAVLTLYGGYLAAHAAGVYVL